VVASALALAAGQCHNNRGGDLLQAMKGFSNDRTGIGMAATESLGYKLIAAKGAGLEPSDVTSPTVKAEFQICIVAQTDSG